MQITYEELAAFISKMTPFERKHPVKFYTGVDGELHPTDKSSHPDIAFSSRMTLATDIYEDEKPSQWVIEEYMPDEDSRECAILHYKTLLLKFEDKLREITQ